MIPVVFHQTLTEEFLFRSVPLWLAKQKDTPYELIPFILGGATFLFAFHHVFNLQMGLSLLSFQLSMAIWLPPALSLMFISLYSQDSVEYSSGMHFGWNFAISILLPIMVYPETHMALSIGLIFVINLCVEAIKIITIVGMEKIWGSIVSYTISPAVDQKTPILAKQMPTEVPSLWKKFWSATSFQDNFKSLGSI